MADETDEPDGFGLDKDSRLEARRRKQLEKIEEEQKSLDPPFPYELRSYDSSFFRGRIDSAARA